MRKSDIDTPALILDLDLVEDNIAVMAAYFRGRPQKLRPHFKTPKTPEIARRQLAAIDALAGVDLVEGNAGE